MGELKKRSAASDPVRHEIERTVLDLVIQLAKELHPAQNYGKLHPRDSLQGKFGIDSLGRAELATRIERALGVRLPDAAIANAESPDDLISALILLQEASKQVRSPLRSRATLAHPFRPPITPIGRRLSSTFSFGMPNEIQPNLISNSWILRNSSHTYLWRAARHFLALRSRASATGVVTQGSRSDHAAYIDRFLP